MSAHSASQRSLTPADVRFIDEVCNRFEDAWKNGDHPRLEECLVNAHSAVRASLVKELLLLEWHYRALRGESPTCAEYLRRFPDDSAAVREIFDRQSPMETSPSTDVQSRAEILASTPTVSPSMQRFVAGGNVPAATAEATHVSPDDRYELLEEIGAGGIGRVYRARDHHLRRELAVKVLKSSHRQRPDMVQRFVAEAQIGAQLQHTGIAPVYEMGYFSDGSPYLAMKLVRGRTLAAMLAGRSSVNDNQAHLLAVFEQVSQAIAYAHAHGVIHRDLKPGNIMVGEFGEVQVMDWGLAKVLADQKSSPPEASSYSTAAAIQTYRTDADQFASVDGLVIGTPAYMPPEQSQGNAVAVNQRADVFALGAILCEILTGTPPYVAVSRVELCRMSQRGELDDARERLQDCTAEPTVRDLAVRCLAVEPSARPADAGVVAQEIAAHLASMENRLHEERLATERQKLLVVEEQKRRRLWTGLSAVALVAMVLAAIAAFTWQANRTRNRQRMALAAQQVEEDLSQATGHIRADDIPRAWVAWNRAAARDGLDASSELAAARDQLKRDLELTEELDRIRLERLVNTGVDLQTPFTGYETAFTNAGFQLWTENEASLVEKLNGSAVRNALTLAIHDWALICELNIHHAGEEVSRQQWKDRRNRLLRIAGQANSDRKLDPIYEPTKWDTPGAMDQYAQQLDAASLSSHLLLLVGLPLADEAREALWRRGQLSHPNDFWINASLASLFDRRGLNDQAVEFYRTALAIRPDSAPLLNNLGRCLHEIERLDEALVCLTRAVEIDPKSWNAYANLGLVFTAREEFDEAARNYQTSIRLHPDPRAWNNLAQVYRSQGDRDAALRALDEAFQLSPEIAEPHANLAAMLEEEGRLDEARERYYRAYRINPELPGLRESLANLFCDAADDCASRQDWSAAIGHLQKSIEVEPTLLRAHIGLAEAHRLSGDLAAAISGYREILRIEPKQADIHYRLGLALAKQHDYEAAAQSLRETLKLNPEAAAVHRLLGITLSQLGRYDEALPHLQESVQSSPNDTDVHVGLGKALCELGRFRESLDELERAQQLGIPDGSRRAIASRWVNEVSRLVELEGQLPKIMSGEIRPQDASEAVSLATLCYHKKRFARSAELFEAAFSSYPETSADVYSNDRRRAIYAAAMAGVGQTESDAELDETARRRWRDTSREWARQCLASYVESLDHGADEARTQIIRRILRQWRQCVELAGVRDADQVVNLTTDERHAWNLFWRDVEAVIDRSARSDIAVTQKNP